MKKITFVLLFLALVFVPLRLGAAAPFAVTANPGTFDDKDLTVWTYTGSWVNYAAARAYKGSYHLSRAINNEAALTFNGERFELIYTRGVGFGVLDIYVDNVLEASLSQSNATTQFQQRWISPTYTDGLHDVRLVHASGARVSVDGIQIFAPPDMTNPASISDLAAATGPTGGSVTLTWTAPGDDSMTGTASSYLVRYAPTEILSETDWDAALPALGAPVPLISGTSETMTVAGLAPGETYFFAVRARDEVLNLGDLSNSPSAAAQTSTPLAVGKYDERASNLLFNGTWINQSPFSAYSRTLRYSTLPGSSVAFMFNGTDIELSYQTSSQMGMMAVYIDGDFVTNINQHSTTTKYQRKWNSPVLANGTHSVQLLHAGGARVNLDAVDVKLNIPVNWPTVSFTPFVSGLNDPVLITHAGDGSGRLFIVEKGGIIRIHQGGGLLATPFLNITNVVNTNANERGLLSLAFPPNYTSKGYFYVFYTGDAGALTLSRFHLTADPNVADANSEQIVLSIPHSANTNHNGGHLAFGPDGYLYLSTGDGGGSGDPANNAQNLNVLLGKMLRLDVETGSPTTYTVPASNPFVGVAGLDEIWAYGLRNPWRYSFDRLTGDIYIADVGQNLWEEIDFQPAGFAGGANYGWRILEGNHCYNPAVGCVPPTSYVAPIVEYNHGSNDSYGCSITGGYVYRGATYTSMQGIYFSADFCTGRVFGVQKVSDIWFFKQLAQPGVPITSFGEDAAGNLYLVSYNGTIYQVVSP